MRDFVNAAAAELDMKIHWVGQGVDEKGYWVNQQAKVSTTQVQEPVVRVDSRYFRPAEVETLLGDASKAREKLGWSPKIIFRELVAEMVREDLKSAERNELVKSHGYPAFDRMAGTVC